jgi:hypothetical protein
LAGSAPAPTFAGHFHVGMTGRHGGTRCDGSFVPFGSCEEAIEASAVKYVYGSSLSPRLALAHATLKFFAIGLPGLRGLSTASNDSQSPIIGAFKPALSRSIA